MQLVSLQDFASCNFVIVWYYIYSLSSFALYIQPSPEVFKFTIYHIIEMRRPHLSYTYDVTMFRDTFESRFTYLNGFLRNVSRFGDRPAVFDPHSDRRWTYRELNCEVNRLAHALRADGVGKNDVVMFALLNSRRSSSFCYLAAHKIGAVACPVNLPAGRRRDCARHRRQHAEGVRIRRRIRRASSRALEMCENKAVPLSWLSAQMRMLSSPPDAGATRIMFASVRRPIPRSDFAPHIYDETTRLYTSGTTNRPKGVPINNINEVLSAHDVMMHFPLSPVDRTMNMTPWFHRGGIHSGGPCPTLYAGGEVVILRDFAPAHLSGICCKIRDFFPDRCADHHCRCSRARRSAPRPSVCSARHRHHGCAVREERVREIHEAADAQHFQRLRHDARRSGIHSCVPLTCPTTQALPDARARTMRFASSPCGRTASAPSRMRLCRATARPRARSSSPPLQRALSATSTTRK